MDNPHFDGSDAAERYVTGRMSAEERSAFEAHFVDCPQCLDRIETAEGLRDGLASFAPGQHRRALPLRLPGRSRPLAFPMVLAASIVLLLAVSVGLSLRAGGRAGKALEAERIAAAQTAEKLADVERKLGSVETALKQEREARSALEGQLDRERHSPLQVPVFALIATRGEETQTLTLPTSLEWIVISLERESPPRFKRYRVTLSADQKQLWRGEAQPSSPDQLAIGFHSSLLPPGAYGIQLEGISPGGRLIAVGRHSFRVVAARPGSLEP